ncbi:MAG: metallophosphoesterase [Candidatus Bathyarchaeia archaeon]|nr:metallophosphoesterase family protein [Candidatus Bathyarchaeota archaeon]
MVKIGIFSDTHIGRSVPKAIGELRREAFKKAFTQAINVFIQEKVDYIIHCGDVFERETMNPSDSIFVKNEFQRLIDSLSKDTKIFVVRGNHDGTPVNNALNYIEHPLAKYFKIIGEKTLENKIEFYEESNFILTGMGYTPYPTYKFKTIQEKIKKALKASKAQHKIFLLHAFIDGHHNLPPGVPEHQKIPIEELKNLEVNLIIAGHNHTGKNEKIDEITFLTPGSTECYDLAENEPHGIYILELNEKEELQFKTIEPMNVIETIKIDGGEAVKNSDWFISKALIKVEDLIGKIKKINKKGIIRLILKGLIHDDKYELENQIREKLNKNALIIHLEVENQLKELTESIQTPSIVSKEEFLKTLFEPLGLEALTNALTLVEEVEVCLEEGGSQRSGLLKDLDRKKFVKKWMEILGV